MINTFEEYKKKKELFIKYNKSYYDLNSPKVDDATFDQLKKILIEFEKNHNVNDKITDTVGFAPSEKFSK
jgi:DNA ligase (NAD+)